MPELEKIDYITGFYTRAYLEEFLENLVKDCANGKKRFALALFDLDKFKYFNDKFGHAFGDEILRYISSMLHMTLSGPQYKFFRYGGDEFIVVFLEKEPREALHMMHTFGTNILHRHLLFEKKFYKFKITFSCGITAFPDDTDSAADIVKKADEAMYFSKRTGRNRITLFGRLKHQQFYNGLKTFAVSIFGITIIALAIFLIASLKIFKLDKSEPGRIAGMYGTSLPVRSGKNLGPALGKSISDFNMDNAKSDSSKGNGIITLMNGNIIKGYIIEETADEVAVNLKLGQGEGTLRFRKSDIADVKYDSDNPHK